MPTIAVRGVNLHFEEKGAGQPVLCLPGALGTGMTDFGPQLETWSAEFCIIAPDPRGYGQSRPPNRDFPHDFFQRDADDMAALMTALGHDQFLLAGWSDGANSAALLASAYPERVTRLAIWGGNSYISSEDLDRIEKIRMISSWSPRMQRTLGNVYGGDLQDLWSFYCDSLQAYFATDNEICRKKLEAIRCPTLILHSAEDAIVPSFHPEVFHQGIAGSRLHVFPQGRHNIHLALAEHFNRIVLPFLSE